ncbi:MAG: CpaF family protein [Elusimicrobia bacterium]|nr:CpaF family protein [Elusimicrobiota bacterium]
MSEVFLGPLESLMEDPGVSDILVTGTDKIYVERSGKLEKTDKKFASREELDKAIDSIAAPLGKKVNADYPLLDGRMYDGSRINIVVEQVALDGPLLSIRKFSQKMLDIESLVSMGSISANMVEFIRLCVIARKNIIVSGGTGSGKTTFLNICSTFIPEDERIVTIEDAAELQLQQDHVARMESRPPDMEGKGEIPIRRLVINALRMRPERIVIGECRGGEALDMLQAMNTGHDGSLTTVHANNPRDALKRLEVLVMMSGIELPSRAIREQIAAAIQVIVQLSRMQDGSRKITEITEITGLEGNTITTAPIFKFRQSGLSGEGKVEGAFSPTGTIPTFLEALRSKGIEIDMKIFQ